MARRRLEALRHDLTDAGLTPRPVATEDEPPAPVTVAPAGRHLRIGSTPAGELATWLEDRLPTTLRGRVRIGGREAALVVLLAALGLVAAAVLVLRSGSGGDPVALSRATAPTGLLTEPAAPPGGPTASIGAGAAISPSSSAEVTVDVSGRVRRPGVVTLPAGARVIDALHEAGGARPHADLDSVNLARVLADGEQIVIGRRGASAATGMAASAAATQPATGSLVNLNTATEEQLESLSGVGPVTAQKILAWRTAHGSFSSLDELLEVDGIGPKTLAELAPHLTL